MASGKKKLLVAGLLTAVAAGAFYTFSGNNDKPSTQQPQEQVDAAIIERIDQLDYIMAQTKDNRVLHIYVDVPQLSNGGTTTDADLAKDIRTQSRIGLMSVIYQWDKADIAANVGSIETGLTGFLARNVTVGVDKNGALIPATEGVNFAAPKIQKITDAKTNEVLFQLPAAAPAIVTPAAPKPPGS